MNEIFFIVLAFLTVFLSVRLSYYADLLSKTSKVSKAFIGGIVLAGITSLPEFVTCFSAIIVDNPPLAMGDILGSNLFNIFMVCFFDILFFKKMILTKVNNSHAFVYLFLIVNYIFIYLYLKNIVNVSLFSIGLPSVVIVIMYLCYLKKISNNNEEDDNFTNSVSVNYVPFKLFLTAVFMVISSILLTITVNKIAVSNPEFSGSVIGAILLGITTSLPEVITFYTLIMLNSYDLALSNIIGSNLFNLLVLAIADILVCKAPIYEFSDSDNLVILILGIVFTVTNLFQSIRKKAFSKFTYILPSCIIVMLYFCFWVRHFIMG